MLEACRTCLRLIDVDNLPFFEIEADGVHPSTESCRYKLLSLIPEMALNITPKSLICVECHGSLEALFEFKEKCLKTENIITQYFKAKPDVDLKNLDLKDVLSFNTSHSGDTNVTEDEAVEAFIEDGKKEEFEAYESITIVKHEIDDYLSESFEVVQPENMVLELKKEPEIRCQVCSKSFEQRCEWERHMLIHTNEWPYKCMVLLERIALNNHVDIHSKVRTNNCKIHDKSFSSNKDLVQPRKRNESEKSKLRCHVCPKSFKWKSLLEKHILIHTNERPYKCTVCSKGFIYKGTLKTHAEVHSQDEKYECEVCNKVFSTNNYLNAHSLIHSGVRNFACEYCSKRFITRRNLNRHLDVHKKPHRCEICDRRFGQKMLLKMHLRTHTGERLYSCKVCGKGFRYSSYMKVHERRHTGERPYICTVCDKGFPSNCGLNRHKHLHTDERPYTCSVCDKCFARKDHLESHARVHTKERPHCEKCQKKFKTLKCLARHIGILHKDFDINTNEHFNASAVSDVKEERRSFK